MQNFLVTFKAIHAQAKRILTDDFVGGFACPHDVAVLEKFARLWAEEVVEDRNIPALYLESTGRNWADEVEAECYNQVDFLDDLVRQTAPRDDYEFALLSSALVAAAKEI